MRHLVFLCLSKEDPKIKTLTVILAFAVVCSASAFSRIEAATSLHGDEHQHALKSVSCDPACGFSVKSHDEKEIVSFVQTHAKMHHNKDVSEADVKKMMKEEKEPDKPK